MRQGDYPVVQTEGNPYSEGVRELYTQLLRKLWKRRKPNQAILAIGHLQATGSEIAEKDYSERTVIGGLECVSPEAFPEQIAYTALGHIHKAQRVSGRENVRYAGSPIPMSFAERHYHHGVVMVAFDGGCAVDIRRIECPKSIPLISVPSGEPELPEKILEMLGELPETEGTAPYLEVKVLLEEPEPMLRQEIEDVLADKNYRLARIVSSYRTGAENVEKEETDWKKDYRRCHRCRLHSLHLRRFISQKCRRIWLICFKKPIWLPPVKKRRKDENISYTIEESYFH